MKKIQIGAAVAALVAAVTLLAASSGAQRLIIDEVALTEQPDCSQIRVSFNFPVRYVKHFPYSHGADLRIQLTPMTAGISVDTELYERETFIPPPNDITGLSEVVYEGDVEGGPYLTLFFRRPVRFQVQGGADFRSVVIAVSGPESTELCEPEK